MIITLTKKRKKLVKISFTLIFFFCFFYIQNNLITITNIDFINKKIPSSFNDFKIVQISDLHNKKFLFNQSQLIEKTKKANPDIIVITGDFIDSRRYNLENSLLYIREAIKIAPIYFVSGNHESRNDVYTEVITALRNEGVIILDNDIKSIKINDEEFNLVGVSDPLVFNPNGKNKNIKNSTVAFEERLKELSNKSKNNFNILLSHRPEFFSLYLKYNFDLTLTGHAHGGQIRFPLVGGLFSPGEGFLPKYTEGLYSFPGVSSSMIVNRGLGNSAFPLRIFNRPEIISITLKNN